MQIREPKFKLGERVIDKKGNVSTVIKFNSYHFEENEYWYDVSYDGENLIKTESYLESYLEPYPKNAWELQDGDECYFINVNGSVLSGPWDGNPLQIGSRKTGNVFLTKDEAESESERRKIEAEMIRLGGRRKFNRGKDNYFIMYTRIEGLDYVNYQSMHEQGVIYFDSELDAINAVKTIGKDKIKKYIFVES